MRDDRGQAVDANPFQRQSKHVDLDDARNHLADHRELYWSVGFRIAKELLYRFTDSSTSWGAS